MSSAICFHLDQSKILSSSYGLMGDKKTTFLGTYFELRLYLHNLTQFLVEASRSMSKAGNPLDDIIYSHDLNIIGMEEILGDTIQGWAPWHNIKTANDITVKSLDITEGKG